MAVRYPGRIVVTGAAGRLGHALVQALGGNDILGIDRAERPRDLDIDYLQAELSDSARIGAALRRNDLLIHVASVHALSAVHSERGVDHDDPFIDLNVRATWRLYRTAATVGITRVILTSSMASYGTQLPTDLRVITEDDRYGCSDLYCLSKRIQEDIAEGFAISGGIATAALRPPSFVPLDPLVFGFGLTGLDGGPSGILEEIVEAHVAAVAAMVPGGKLDLAPGLQRITLTSRLPFDASDAATLGEPDGHRRLVDKYWPGAWPWLTERGFTPRSTPMIFDTSPAYQLLGWRSRLSFDEWFAEHRDRL